MVANRNDNGRYVTHTEGVGMYGHVQTPRMLHGSVAWAPRRLEVPPLAKGTLVSPTDTARQHGNALLDRLSPTEYERLGTNVEHVTLDVRTVLFQPDELITDVYFPTAGMVSLAVIMEDGTATEVATIGKEGMVGTPVFLGTESMPVQAICQVAGEALRMRSAALRKEAKRDGGLHDALERYTQALFTQIAQASVCNRLHPIEERMARWLVMTHDRVGVDEFGLTQEFLAEMLGVRRATVTVTAGALQKAGYIKYSRGHIRIVDRAGLEAATCECYGVIKQEYDRLLGKVD